MVQELYSIRAFPIRDRSRQRLKIYLALSVSLALHILILSQPVPEKAGDSQKKESTVSLKLSPQVTDTAPLQIEPINTAEIPQKREFPDSLIPKVLTRQSDGSAPLINEVTVIRNAASEIPQKVEELSKEEKSQLTRRILARQFITTDTESTEFIPLSSQVGPLEAASDFIFPVREDMYVRMYAPLPDLPFAYQQGFMEFSYAPGFQGDVQRFWDVITPEFGFRTDGGFEVQCVLALVILGCAWD